MGHLEESIFGRDRPDPDRLEENVIAGVSRHRA
jgi:hypothetical protein